MSDHEKHREHQRRDVESFFIKGTFFIIMALAVLVGTIWAKTFEATVTNLGAGLVLLGVGGWFLYFGLRIKRQL